MPLKSTANQITEGVIWKQLLRFFFPILLGTFFQQMYNTADTIIVGRFVGTQALAAVGSTAPFLNLVNGFFIGLSTGATVLLSQFFGANDRQGVRNALHTGVVLSVILGAATAIVGISSAPFVLKLTKIPPNCLDDALLYSSICFAGALASMVYNMGSGILRAMGDSKRPLIFLIITCFLNIGMDILCVAILDLGVAGAALATLISQVISAVLILLVLCGLPEDYRLRIKHLRLHKDLLKRILQIGLPAGLQFITFDVSNVLIQSGINSFGDITMAAWTAYVKTDGITWMVSGAFGVAITTFVGQNFGAQKYARVRQSVWVCMGMSVSLMALLSTLMLLARHFILGIYTTDTQVVLTGAYIMLWIVPFNSLFMPVEVFAGAMRGTGYSTVPTIITCLSVCVFRILWVIVMVGRWHTVEMLALAYPISWALAALVFYIVYLRGNWLKKRIEACGMPPEIR